MQGAASPGLHETGSQFLSPLVQPTSGIQPNSTSPGPACAAPAHDAASGSAVTTARRVANLLDAGASSAQAASAAESMAEKIRRRRAELEAEEAQKLMAEYAKNRANSAASVANDNFGRALQ